MRNPWCWVLLKTPIGHKSSIIQERSREATACSSYHFTDCVHFIFIAFRTLFNSDLYCAFWCIIAHLELQFLHLHSILDFNFCIRWSEVISLYFWCKFYIVGKLYKSHSDSSLVDITGENIPSAVSYRSEYRFPVNYLYGEFN